MRPSVITYSGYQSRKALRDASSPRLSFSPFTPADMPVITPMLEASPSRTCDFSIGGIYMWTECFDYSRAIVGDTLFIKGLNESDRSKPAFSVPVGAMPLSKSIELLRDYCRRHSMPLSLSAVPEDRLEELRTLGAYNIEPLPDWADYLYDLGALATFSGKKLSKKRNHVNRFMADNPDAVFEPLTPDNASKALDFLNRLEMAEGKSDMAYYERQQVERVLSDFGAYPFEGAILSVPGKGIVAFTAGEVVGDTLHVHIEKMDHEVAGAGETVCRNFAAMMLERHPQLRYENREDDSGDLGLRQGKLSYHPTALLMKYNLELPL